ncbi:MAG: hypothetical protein M1275_00070 [Patescibacteria group bacterium]|nr:hypothetical protein [Patescibacteria group bacterium]
MALGEESFDVFEVERPECVAARFRPRTHSHTHSHERSMDSDEQIANHEDLPENLRSFYFDRPLPSSAFLTGHP